MLQSFSQYKWSYDCINLIETHKKQSIIKHFTMHKHGLKDFPIKTDKPS